MLFSVKTRMVPTLVLLALFVVGAFLARELLQLQWRLGPQPGVVGHVVLGLSVILLGDGLLHGGLRLAFGERYLARYRALGAYFRQQGPREIAAAGLLAGGGEELLFRGVLLQALLERASLHPAVAVGAAALLFGVLHILPDPRLAPFAFWAVWQGVLLGCLYVWSGSLLAVMLVHGGHDAIGFSLLAGERDRLRNQEGNAGPKHSDMKTR